MKRELTEIWKIIEDIGKSVGIEKIMKDRLQRAHRMNLLKVVLSREWIFSK